jgi:hypothetical protein
LSSQLSGTPQASQTSTLNKNHLEEQKENYVLECEICSKACLYNPESDSTLCTGCAVESVKAELELQITQLKAELQQSKVRAPCHPNVNE